MRKAFYLPGICNLMNKTLTVIVERDEEGRYVGSVPELPGCHTQAKTLDELMERIKEAIELYLEVEPDILQGEISRFVGIHHVEVSYDECTQPDVLSIEAEAELVFETHGLG